MDYKDRMIATEIQKAVRAASGDISRARNSALFAPTRI